MDRISRRRFLRDSTTMAAGVTVAAGVNGRPAAAADASAEGEVAFASQWHRCVSRPWLGQHYWANPLSDWRIRDGRAECIQPGGDRNIHLLTHRLGNEAGDLRMSVKLGRLDGTLGDGEGTAGFRIGVKGPLEDHRNALLHRRGLDAGLTSDGTLFIGGPNRGESQAVPTDRDAVVLRLHAEPGENGYTVRLSAHDAETDDQLAETTRNGINAPQLVGNISLVANFGRNTRQRHLNQGAGRFWFADWHVAGSKVAHHPDDAFGPVLFNHYTLSGGIMKMTAQMPPVGEDDPQQVQLQVQRGDAWQTIAEADIDPDARTATFRVEDWDDTVDTPYRLRYPIRYTDGEQEQHDFAGLIRRDPVDRDELVVADVSCNIHAAFPNAEFVERMAKVDPDLLAFTGDQFYEGSGGYGISRGPLDEALLDHLHHWNLHGMTWRDLTRNRPSICIPDDHDVYHGNLWGEGGKAMPPEAQGTSSFGGYLMDARWVNAVHRSQTSHHPDPYDPTPIKQDISVYYGPLTYGGVSFAIIADRMFKTGPDNTVPETETRIDWVTDPDFDPATADVPEAVLLGDRQMSFLRDWARDWRGAQMKAVISQTIFNSMATHHGQRDHYLVADYDANGWPQTPRNEAVQEIRKCFAVHLAGDQHLPAVIHYGVDEHGDAGLAFAGPAVNVGYLRWFDPDQPGENRAEGAAENTGDFIDGFGHPLTVRAVHNPGDEPNQGPPLERMRNKASGLGLVRFDKAARRISIECWPYLADPTQDAQCEGWPVVADQTDNYGRKVAGYLPEVGMEAVAQPVVEVHDEETDELVYTLRAPAERFRPFVFDEGAYTVKVGDPESDRWETITGQTISERA